MFWHYVPGPMQTLALCWTSAVSLHYFNPTIVVLALENADNRYIEYMICCLFKIVIIVLSVLD